MTIKNSLICLGLLLSFALLLSADAQTPETRTDPNGEPTIVAPDNLEDTRARLEIEKIRLENEKLSRETNRSDIYRLLAELGAAIPATTALVVGGFAVLRYFADRRDAMQKRIDEANRINEDRKAERSKIAEVRFTTAVEKVLSDDVSQRIAGAVLLRTFLQPDHETFYLQVFDFVVAVLRGEPEPKAIEAEQDRLPPMDRFVAPEPRHRAFIEAMAAVFADAAPLARDVSGRPEEGLDARFIRLAWARVHNADLKYISLNRSILFRADLSRSNLSSVDLTFANVSGAKLEGTVLASADLSHSDLSWCQLLKTEMISSTCKGTRLSDASFQGCQLENIDLTECEGSGTLFVECDMRNAVLYYARLRDCAFYRSDLSGSDFSGARLQGCEFNDAIMTNVNVSGAVLDGAILNGADLTGINFRVVGSMRLAQMHGVTGVDQAIMTELEDQWGVYTN